MTTMLNSASISRKMCVSQQRVGTTTKIHLIKLKTVSTEL